MESIFEVNLQVNFRTRDRGNDIVQEGKGVVISLSDVVQSSIIYTDAQFAGRLGDQDNRLTRDNFDGTITPSFSLESMYSFRYFSFRMSKK